MAADYGIFLARRWLCACVRSMARANARWRMFAFSAIGSSRWDRTLCCCYIFRGALNMLISPLAILRRYSLSPRLAGVTCWRTAARHRASAVAMRASARGAHRAYFSVTRSSLAHAYLGVAPAWPTLGGSV